MGTTAKHQEGTLFYALRGGLFPEFEKAKITEQNVQRTAEKGATKADPGDFHVYGYDYDRERRLWLLTQQRPRW